MEKTTESWSIHGIAWNRHEGFVEIVGAIQSGNNSNGVPSYFTSYWATSSQAAQIDTHGIGFYLVMGKFVIEQDKLNIISSSTERFSPANVVGYSKRQDIMVNADYFGGECSISPWKCWDTNDGFKNVPIIRMHEEDLSFLPPYLRPMEIPVY